MLCWRSVSSPSRVVQGATAPPDGVCGGGSCDVVGGATRRGRSMSRPQRCRQGRDLRAQKRGRWLPGNTGLCVRVRVAPLRVAPKPPAPREARAISAGLLAPHRCEGTMSPVLSEQDARHFFAAPCDQCLPPQMRRAKARQEGDQTCRAKASLTLADVLYYHSIRLCITLLTV